MFQKYISDNNLDKMESRISEGILNTMDSCMENYKKGIVSEMMDLSEFKEDVIFEEKYIPSKDVRTLIESEGWTFSDRDKATIIWNSDRPILEKLEDLKNILSYTKDADLAEQIRERYDYDLSALSVFAKDTEGFVYATNTYEFPGEDNIIGYYSSEKLALNSGVKSGYAFKIEKYQIIGEDTVLIKPWSIISPLLESDINKQIEECVVFGITL